MVVVTQPCEYTKTTELYTLKGQILAYVNYISIIKYSKIQFFSYDIGKNPKGEAMEKQTFSHIADGSGTTSGGNLIISNKITNASISFDPVISLWGMIKL